MARALTACEAPISYHPLNEEKTKLVPFSKRAQQDGCRAEAFGFLGFTFYWGRSRRGAVVPKMILQEIRHAWITVYGMIAEIMIDAAED